MSSPQYVSLYVTVTLNDNNQVICDQNPLQIPENTIATITFKPGEGSNLTFVKFKWCDTNGFLTQDPIYHPQCVITAVNNTTDAAEGDWAYHLRVAVGTTEYHTPRCKDPAGDDGKPVIHNQ